MINCLRTLPNNLITETFGISSVTMGAFAYVLLARNTHYCARNTHFDWPLTTPFCLCKQNVFVQVWLSFEFVSTWLSCWWVREKCSLVICDSWWALRVDERRWHLLLSMAEIHNKYQLASCDECRRWKAKGENLILVVRN
jgi:hypothetical protein